MGAFSYFGGDCCGEGCVEPLAVFVSFDAAVAVDDSVCAFAFEAGHVLSPEEVHAVVWHPDIEKGGRRY